MSAVPSLLNYESCKQFCRQIGNVNNYSNLDDILFKMFATLVSMPYMNQLLEADLNVLEFPGVAS